jgi:hypothetical protein
MTTTTSSTETKAKPAAYRVWWTNHGYYSQEEFTRLADAIAYGKSKCFEFSVHQGDTMHVSWGPISGLHAYTTEGRAHYGR